MLTAEQCRLLRKAWRSFGNEMYTKSLTGNRLAKKHYDMGRDIVLELMEQEHADPDDENEYLGPDWVCLSCGEVDVEQFRTVTYDSVDGVDYDMECNTCGGMEFADGHVEAIQRLTSRVDNLQAELEERDAKAKSSR